MPIPAALAAAGATALANPYVRGALFGTAMYGADRAVQGGIKKGLKSKRKVIRKIAGGAAKAYEFVDKNPIAGIVKNTLAGAASDSIGRKARKFQKHQKIGTSGLKGLAKDVQKADYYKEKVDTKAIARHRKGKSAERKQLPAPSFLEKARRRIRGLPKRQDRFI